MSKTTTISLLKKNCLLKKARKKKKRKRKISRTGKKINKNMKKKSVKS